MTDTDTLYMFQLEKNIRAEVRAEAHNLVDSYSDDILHEMADSWVPVYTSALLNLAAHDNSLATVEPELGPAFDGTPTPVNIIAANVYERLWAAAFDEWAEVESGIVPCCDCGRDLLPEDQLVVNVELARHSMNDPVSSDVACKECVGLE